MTIPIRRAELLFREWPTDNRVGNQHVKFFLARYAVEGLGVHRTSPRSHKDMNNLFLFAMLAVNSNLGLFHACVSKAGIVSSTLAVKASALQNGPSGCVLLGWLVEDTNRKELASSLCISARTARRRYTRPLLDNPLSTGLPFSYSWWNCLEVKSAPVTSPCISAEVRQWCLTGIVAKVIVPDNS